MTDNHYTRALFESVKQNNYEDCVRFIDLGANVNFVFENSENLLIYNMLNDYNSNIFKLLLERGCNVDFEYKCCNNSTPLYIAIMYNNYDACKLLIENGANVNVKIQSFNKKINNISYLHNVASSGSFNLCELLVNNGADVLATNSNGNRPSYYLNINSKTYQYLKQKEEEREILNASFKRAHIDDYTDEGSNCSLMFS